MKTIKQIYNKLFGRKIMATANYTQAMTDKMVETYSANPTKETVAELAKELGKNTRSVIAKLSREGVYQAQPRVTKSGEPIIRKAELVATSASDSRYRITFPSESQQS
jgi:hypothetical protein